MKSRRASKTDVVVLIFALSRDRDSAHFSNRHGVSFAIHVENDFSNLGIKMQ